MPEQVPLGAPAAAVSAGLGNSPGDGGRAVTQRTGCLGASGLALAEAWVQRATPAPAVAAGRGHRQGSGRHPRRARSGPCGETCRDSEPQNRASRDQEDARLVRIARPPTVGGPPWRRPVVVFTGSPKVQRWGLADIQPTGGRRVLSTGFHCGLARPRSRRSDAVAKSRVPMTGTSARRLTREGSRLMARAAAAVAA